MKKITFIVTALLMSTFLFAQNVVLERPADGGNSLIAVQGNDGTGVFVGDSFTLAADTNIGAVQIFGTNSNAGFISPFLTGLNVFIYADAGGVPAGDPTLPGTGVLELADIDLANVNVNEDGVGASDFTVNNIAEANGGTPVVLAAGTYWMVAYPSVDSPPADATAGRWNWTLSTAVAPSLAQLIDPFDLFGAGATNWTSIEALIGAPAASLAWTLFDDTALAVNDNGIEDLSLSPNPTNGVVNITLPGNRTLSNVSVYDVTGREVISINDDINSLDLGNFSTGIYIARLTTTDGATQAVRIVKQ